ncbi:Rossmann-like and DUF2520 domain-containing protein [Christiangramia salexigens]|uniref:Uncharacterized protein n=1 Tax=Christiangramia salexigens TaxID=1913577 RepID=A0A1L3J2T8_9FLAO|nr:Rossmann-like and DUF2520 domain-containing protein [Christiangramia salexigens]APG59435.1 hypothetical protein LPB144_02990 [Christiangramia salexigens]
MIKVVIIGGGNLATHLYQTLSLADHIEVIQIYNRNLKHLKFVQDPELAISDSAKIKDADLYLLAIKDEAIAEFAENLSGKDGIIAHCSGSQNLNQLSKMKNYGVFYPLQSFSKDKPVNFKKIPICIEANNTANLKRLKEIAHQISDQVFEVDSEQRKALHLSAVFVNNFTNHLFTIASDYCEENELPFNILLPLIRETVAKIDTLPPYSAQTGPALRNDQKTISAHLEMLNPDRKKIYTILTESIQKVHGKKL